MSADDHEVIELLSSSGDSSALEEEAQRSSRTRTIQTSRRSSPPKRRALDNRRAGGQAKARSVTSVRIRPAKSESSSEEEKKGQDHDDGSSGESAREEELARARRRRRLKQQSFRTSHGVRVSNGRRRKRPYSVSEVEEESSSEESEEGEKLPLQRPNAPAPKQDTRVKKARTVERPATVARQQESHKVPASRTRYGSHGSSGMRQIAEGMSFSELQAQEQAMARFQAQNARRASRVPSSVPQAVPKQQQTSKKSPLARNEPAVRTKTKRVATNRSSDDARARQPVTVQIQTQTARKTMRLPLKRRLSSESDKEEEAMSEDTSLGTEAAEGGASRGLNLKASGERPSTSVRPVATTASGKRQLDVDRAAPGSGVQKPSKMTRPVAKKRYASSSEDSDDDEVEGESDADESTLVRGKATKGQDGRRQKLDTEKNRPIGQRGGLSTLSPSAKHHQAQKPPTSRVGSVTIHVAPGAPLHGLNEMQLITEGMSFSELQAQHEEFKRYQKQKKRELSGASSTLRKGERSRRQNGNGGERRARMGVRPKPDQAPSSSPPMLVTPPSRNGFLAPLSEPKLSTSGTSDTGGASASTETLTKPTIPVIHSTAWRRLVFTEAPPNVLDVSVIPYALGSDKPLWDYDSTGTLKKRCALVAEIGQGIIITEENFDDEPTTQKEVDAQVRDLVEKELPCLKDCHARRVRAVVKEMRRDVAKYLAATRVLRGERRRRMQWSRLANHQSWLDVSPIERVAARQLLQNRPPRKPFNSLVGSVCYALYRDQNAFETVVCPETVTHLANDFTSLRRSFTMIGVRKNVRVDDDPILRYVPYLGDNEHLAIDHNRYDGTTMNKEQRVTVLGDDKSELKAFNPGARDDEVMECLLRVVVTECGGSAQVFHALQHEMGFDRPRVDYDEMMKLNKAEQRTTQRIVATRQYIAGSEVGSSPLKGVSAGKLSGVEAVRALARPYWFLQDAPELRTLPVRLLPPMTFFVANYVRFPAAEGIQERETYEDLTEWHRDMFCRRCFLYDCNEHGIQDPRRSHRADPINPVVTVPGIVLQSRELGMQGGGFSTKEDKSKAADPPVKSAEVIELEDSSSTNDEPLVDKSSEANSRQSTEDSTARRRSRRSQTRISSLASASLQVQEEMQERERLLEDERQHKRRQKFARAADNSEYLDDSYLPTVNGTLQKLLSKTQLCSPDCWKAAATDSSSSPPQGHAKLSQVDTLLVRKLASTFGPNPCVVSAMLKSATSTCAQITSFLAEEKTRKEGDHDMLTSGDRRLKQGRRQSAATGGNRSLATRKREPRIYNREKTLSYEPCSHGGVCDEKCDCMLRNHRCNKACSCPRDCPNRFQGCKCDMGSCRTSSCSCVEAGRECDPDYCFSCGATDAAVMAFHPGFRSRSSYDMNICCNVNMLRGRFQKKVGIAFSATHGWGAFALEPIRKGDFVLEYTGALISDDEAERRGAIYDRLKVSYLFNVNSDQDVDAARTGNKAKFANHCPAEAANLAIKILDVNGEHRIGLFASETIELGDEIFFDYGYTHDGAPTWSQQRVTDARRRAYSIDEEEEQEWEWG